VAEAWGCKLDVDPAQRVGSTRPEAGHKASMLQDLEARRPMEIDAIVMAPLAFARAAGVPTPTLEVIAAVLAARARVLGLYAG
jgi:2-dehydropantoate 2-reductase